MLDTGVLLLVEWSSANGDFAPLLQVASSPASGPNMDEISNFAANSLAIMFLAFVLVMIAMMIRVIAKDARRRGKNPALVVLLCLLSFPLGWIVWLIFRPPPVATNRAALQR
jgi:hypothetical protein